MTDDDDDDDYGNFPFSHPGYVAVWFFLSVVYLLLEIYGTYRLSLSTDQYYSFLVQPQKLFYVLLIFGCIARIVYFILQPLLIFGFIVLSNTLNNFLSLFPGFIFFSAFLVLLFLWIEAYYIARESPIRHLKHYFYVTIAVMWVCFACLIVCDAIYCRISNSTKATQDCSSLFGGLALTPCEKGVYYFDAVVYISISFFFTLFGVLIFLKMRSVPTLKRRKQVLRKVLLMSSMCVIAFLTRAVMTLINIFDPYIFNVRWVADGLYWTLLEALPILLFLIILRSNEREANPTSSSINNNSNLKGHHYGGSNSSASSLLGKINEPPASRLTIPPYGSM